MDCSASPGTEGIIDIDNVSSEPAVLQLRGHIKFVMNNCSDKMKLMLGRFGVQKDLSVFAKKFEDPHDLLLSYKAFCPSTFIYPQPENENDIDDPTCSDNALHNNDSTSTNQDTLERLVEMVDAVSMKNTDNNDHEVVVNEESINMDTGMSNETINIYDNENMCLPMQTFKNVLEGLGNYSVDLGKGCELALEGITSLELKQRDIGSMSSDRKFKSLTGI